MKKFIFIFLVLAAMISFSYDYTMYDLGIAHKISVIEDKPLIIYFSSPSCVYCKKFESEVLSDEKFQELLKLYYTFVKVESNNNKTTFLENEYTNNELFGAFGVRGTPTFVFWYKDAGITMVPGFMPLEDFLNALNYILKYVYEDYREDFQTFLNNKESFNPKTKVINISNNDADFVLAHDKNAKKYTSDQKIEKGTVYLVYSNEDLEKLKQSGAFRILFVNE
ncbi:thioredoxin-related protein [Thermosipho japonicus]|uniref:Thioredoxin-related protein n=1 Tax=Thermosipho japonicus TaxID=90323 RepID=A0A841GQY8_9BACT|nr:thioredoxin fold domain-containing protein [Thermosipho japonicus]MBB6062069.1 thioredoxin-related protein [Thermosipho japonicus]